jgi:hypothetical protein
MKITLAESFCQSSSSSRYWLSMLAGLVCCAIVLGNRPAHAYLTFGDWFYGGEKMKWGDEAFGTEATITWGYMADGTVAAPGFRIDLSYSTSGVTGGSQITDLRDSFDDDWGEGQFNAAIQNAFNTWASVANITFVGPVTDSGLPINDPGAAEPMIRIGAFTPEPGHSFNNVAAVGFAPPPNGGTLEGDILFNVNKLFQVAEGDEDATLIDYFPDGNDLEGLMLHEIGHALGLAHAPTGPSSVMYDGPGAYLYINRYPSIDDIAGIRRIYGPTPLGGDFDLDDDVDGDDFAIWQANFPKSTGGYLDIGDADNDGDVDGADFVIWQTNFPAGGLESTAVPEPHSFGAMLVAVFLLAACGAAKR